MIKSKISDTSILICLGDNLLQMTFDEYSVKALESKVQTFQSLSNGSIRVTRIELNFNVCLEGASPLDLYYQ